MRTRKEAGMSGSVGAIWWLILVRGLSAMAFGVAAFAWPRLTVLALVLLYGCYALFDGLVALYAALASGGPISRWWLLVAGIAGVIVGATTLAWPGMTALLLVVFIGGSAIVRGVLEIIGAIRLRKVIDDEWWLIANGGVSVLFGLILLAAPGAGAIALVWWIGCYALIVGVLLTGLALRLRRHRALAIA
jgi:uncharacterized membrane protein HdeD (DUF308 family)